MQPCLVVATPPQRAHGAFANSTAASSLAGTAPLDRGESCFTLLSPPRPYECAGVAQRLVRWHREPIKAPWPDLLPASVVQVVPRSIRSGSASAPNVALLGPSIRWPAKPRMRPAYGHQCGPLPPPARHKPFVKYAHKRHREESLHPSGNWTACLVEG